MVSLSRFAQSKHGTRQASMAAQANRADSSDVGASRQSHNGAVASRCGQSLPSIGALRMSGYFEIAAFFMAKAFERTPWIDAIADNVPLAHAVKIDGNIGLCVGKCKFVFASSTKVFELERDYPLKTKKAAEDTSK